MGYIPISLRPKVTEKIPDKIIYKNAKEIER